MELTKQQQQVTDDIIDELDSISVEYNREYKLITVGGFAGTGKTTLISELRNRLKKKYKYLSVAFCSFTGKAASVLNGKLKDGNTLFDQDYCGTIHGLIYSAEVIWDKKLKTFVVVGWKRKPKSDIIYNLIIIDEASMVSKEIFDDLKSIDIPIIAFGDHAQLPPIGDKFNLLKSPDHKLTEIHRQSLNSPIIKLSQFVRNEGYIPQGFYSNKVFKLSWNDELCKRIWNEKVDFMDNQLTVLCGFNTTRANLNNNIRKKLGYKERDPYPGEKIVCLSNNHDLKIMNGQIGNVVWVIAGENTYRITTEIDNEMYECMVADRCFGQVTYTMYDKSNELKRMKEYCDKEGFRNLDFFDFGYVISVHKSQGSEWDKIILVEQRTKHWNDEYYMRWLYTAVTRAKESLFVISDMWI